MTVCRLKCAVLAVVASAVGVAFGDIIQPAGTAAKNVEAIQAAIDAAGTGGMVELGAGTFEIDAQLLVANGVTLVGQGREQTTLKLVPQTPGADTRCATVSGGAKLVGLTLTGGHIRNKWSKGAGVFVEDGTISWCCVTNNLLGDASWQGVGCNNMTGAGIYIKKGMIDHTIIANNAAYAPGGGTSSGAGLGIMELTGLVCVDACLICDNVASGSGGGIEASTGSSMEIRNTTIAGNTSSGVGAGIRTSNSGLNLVNSIVTGNKKGDEDNDIDGSISSSSSNNLIGEDVAFIDAANGDYHLAAGSAAIGAGVSYAGINDD